MEWDEQRRTGETWNETSFVTKDEGHLEVRKHVTKETDLTGKGRGSRPYKDGEYRGFTVTDDEKTRDGEREDRSKEGKVGGRRE